MLPKKLRCFKTYEVNSLYKKGIRFGSFLFYVRFLPKNNYKKTLVIISKNISNSAVKRNYIRRSLYDCISQDWELLPDGLFLFSAIGKLKNFEKENISKSFEKILKQVTIK